MRDPQRVAFGQNAIVVDGAGQELRLGQWSWSLALAQRYRLSARAAKPATNGSAAQVA